MMQQAETKPIEPPPPACAHCDAVHSGPGEGAAALPAGVVGMGALLARLRGSEIIVLALKPSLWFIPLTCLPAIVTVVAGLATLWLAAPDVRPRFMWYIQAGLFIVAGRVMWAILQWMGRLYLLTDQRILRVSGVFSVNVYECALRKVAGAALMASLRERMVRIGSIEITGPEECGVGTWQMVARPRHVHAQVMAAIRRNQS